MSTTIATDERKGLPSFSSAERYKLCPGSWQSEQGCPRVSNDDADSGALIHTYLVRNADIVLLDDDEMECAKACGIIVVELIKSVFGDSPVQNVVERRLWLHDHTLNRIASGKIDLLVHDSNRRGLVVDYKTGRNEVENAAGNLQLRGYAVIAAQHYALDEVTVAIVQPWVKPQVSTCRYTMDDLLTAMGEMLQIIAGVNKPNAPRIPGEKQCRWCPARGRCPEAIAFASQLPDVRGTGLAELPAETLSQILDRIDVIERILDAVRCEAKTRIQSGFQIPGWTMKPGVEREKIVNLNTVFGRAEARGVTQQQFVESCGLAKKELKALIKEATKLKGKALDAEIVSITEGCVEVETTAPRLVRVKEET